MSRFAVILPAAGKSSRYKDKHYKKPFAPLNDRAVWLHSAEKFLNRSDVKQLLIVVSPDDHEWFHDKYAANVAIMGIEVVAGGSERQDSVRNALEKVNDDIEYVAIHDAARPCIANEWIESVFEAAKKHGAATLGIPVTSTLKKVKSDGFIDETVAREGLWESQTPQVFRKQLLIEAIAKAGSQPATDEAQILERAGQPVAIVEGSIINLKITTKGDLRLAAHAMKALPKPKTIGGPAHPFDDMWR